jgi:hypothetical protein
MQGLPSQKPTQTSQGATHGAGKMNHLGEGKIDGKTEGKIAGKINAKAEGESAEGESSENPKAEFASLFKGLAGKETAKSEKQVASKPTEVKSETGETLKNLLKEKHSDKEVEGKVVDPKLVKEKTSNFVTGKKGEATEAAIAKTNSNLDQLLNSLKGNQDSEESVGDEEKNPSLKNSHMKKSESIKGAAKNESPLDFLMKGTKEKGVTEESVNPEAKKSGENALLQKRVMTGDDYLKNMQSAEKKAPVLTLINSKNENPAAKGYGQGMNLLSEPLIKNTKDLALKNEKPVKSAVSGVDELHTKETKVSSELASIKQEIVPSIHGQKNNQGQEQTQANANQKVLDLSNVQTSNTSEIIKKISDYIEQSQVGNKQTLDLTVKHESLGEFKIQVSKMPDSANRAQMMDMQITTSSKEGHDFFVKNEVSLMKNLNQAGINLSDLRIVSSMRESTPFGQSDSRQSSSFQQNPDGSKESMSFESQFSSGNSGSGNGAERRKELWEEYQQRYGA